MKAHERVGGKLLAGAKPTGAGEYGDGNRIIAQAALSIDAKGWRSYAYGPIRLVLPAKAGIQSPRENALRLDHRQQAERRPLGRGGMTDGAGMTVRRWRTGALDSCFRRNDGAYEDDG